ncbi:MAG: hypothetical protein ABIV51_08140 [Saprospiraceae bacterium]
MLYRHSLRIHGFDYSTEGAYFITISCAKWKYRFGQILPTTIDADMQKENISNEGLHDSPLVLTSAQIILNDLGQIAQNEWLKLPERFPNCTLGVFQIMPHHMHGILILKNLPNTPSEENSEGLAIKAASIPDIIRSYKSIVYNECLKIYKAKDQILGRLWLRNYHEKILHNENVFNMATNYILNNPDKYLASRNKQLPKK